VRGEPEADRLIDLLRQVRDESSSGSFMFDRAMFALTCSQYPYALVKIRVELAQNIPWSSSQWWSICDEIIRIVFPEGLPALPTFTTDDREAVLDRIRDATTALNSAQAELDLIEQTRQLRVLEEGYEAWKKRQGETK
jgi:hypothetical protein